MALHFSRVAPETEELEIWSAIELGYSFVISSESRSGPGLHGKPGFVASWRPIDFNRSAIKVSGSPFKTFAEAENACEAMVVRFGFGIPRACRKRRPTPRVANAGVARWSDDDGADWNASVEPGLGPTYRSSLTQQLLLAVVVSAFWLHCD
jgi:hypothetical protein